MATTDDQASDESELSLTEEDSTIHTAVIINLVVFSLIILVGNFLTVISLLCFTKKKTPVGILISCVSLVEILNVLGPNLIAIYVYLTDISLSQNSNLCKVQGYLSTFVRLATTTLISLLSVDRMLAVFARKFHRRRWKDIFFKITVSSTWIFSGFAAAWPLLEFGEFNSSTEAPNVHCFFSYTDSFAIFVVSFLLPQFVFVITCSCVLVFKSPGSPFETNFSVSNEKFAVNNRLQNNRLQNNRLQNNRLQNNGLQNPARHLHQRTLVRMCGLVTGIYSFCYLPWIIVVCLSLASVGYPELFSLLCLQLPLVSGLFSPLIYGLMWSPYRRAYIRALSWPGYKCRAILGLGEDNSASLDASVHGRSRTYSFWSADNYIDEDLNPPENAFDVLFGPTSLIRPLEFDVHELQMFEKERETVPREDENPSTIDVTSPSDDVTNPNDDVTNPNDDVTGLGDDVTRPNDEESVQFQSILNLIDELTDGRGAPQATRNESKVKRSKSTLSLLGRFVPFRSADATAPAPASNELYLDDIELYIKNETRVGSVRKSSRRSERNLSKSHLPQEQFWLRRLGRSQVWGVDARPRYLDYLVAERVKEYTSAYEQHFVIDV